MDAASARMTRECAWHVVLLSTVNPPIAAGGALGLSGYEDVVIWRSLPSHRIGADALRSLAGPAGGKGSGGQTLCARYRA